MNFSEFLAASTAAFNILSAYPLQWLGIGLIFIVLIESLMFIPYVGFIVKLSVAGIVGTQFFAMFAAASTGITPRPIDLISAFSLPISTQLVMAFASVLPFAAGMVYLYLKLGQAGIRFFFGNMFKEKPPAKALMLKSKYVMYLFALPFLLLGGEVVLKGSSGFDALSNTFAAAPANWLHIILISLMSVMFELIVVQLPVVLPKWAAGVLSGVLMLVFLCWVAAVTYTVSAAVVGPSVALQPPVFPEVSIKKPRQN